MTRKDILTTGVNLSATLAKYGIKASKVAVIGCGKVAFGSMGIANNLAKTFADDGIGTPIGDMLAKGTNKAISKVANKSEKAGAQFIDWTAHQIKSRI